MEGVLTGFCSRHPRLRWYYGNVYADDEVTPLGWWEGMTTS